MTTGTELQTPPMRAVDSVPPSAVGDAVLARIRELAGRRSWYATHPGWIVQQRVDDMAELRYLLRLRREGRRLFEAAPDAITLARSERDRWITTESELRLMDGNR